MTEPKQILLNRGRSIIDSAKSTSHRAAGFTLVECVIAMGIFAIVSGGILAAWMYGARLQVVANAKLSASDQARGLLATFIHDVRTASLIKVGDGNLANFTAAKSDAIRQGSALQVFRTPATNSFILYYRDGADQNFKRTTNGATRATVLAKNIANPVVFTIEDAWGHPATNDLHAEMVGIILQCKQSVLLGGTNTTTTDASFDQLATKIHKRISMGYQN